MGVNSTEVSYGFGQMGSILTVPAEDIVTSNGVTGNESAVFVAITFLEDTVFADSGLIAEDQTKYFGSAAVSSGGIDTDGGIVTDGIVFPKGITVYGRWTTIDLTSGKVIAYLGY
tara:strand:- start:1204 stop:1548 length:345 start_codon:yes stop_codon:yes gene_type:complete